MGGPETVKVLLVDGGEAAIGRTENKSLVCPTPGPILPGEGGHAARDGPVVVLGLQMRLAPLPGCVATARVTVDVSAVTTLPSESSTVTVGWVAKVTPPAELLGDAVKTSLLAAPATVKAALLPGRRPVAVALRVKEPAVATVILHPAKVATPPVAALGLAVQTRVAPFRVGCQWRA